MRPRAVRFEALGQVARLLSTTLETPRVFTTIADKAVELVGEAVATVWVVEEGESVGAAQLVHPERQSRMQVGDWAIGWIAQAKQP